MLRDRLFRPATAGPSVSPARAAASQPAPPDGGSAAATASDDDSDVGGSNPGTHHNPLSTCRDCLHGSECVVMARSHMPDVDRSKRRFYNHI